MDDLSWPLVVGLGSTGIVMALLSSLVGLRQKVELASWWVLYAGWVAVVIGTGSAAPFWTILFASTIAGVVHSATQALLIDRYIENNPWYAEQMQKPRAVLQRQFLLSGVVIGAGFGALVAGIAWGIDRWVVG